MKYCTNTKEERRAQMKAHFEQMHKRLMERELTREAVKAGKLEFVIINAKENK
jgi:hypothetical protein